LENYKKKKSSQSELVVSKALAKWSKQKFPNAAICIRELKRKLTEFTNRQPGNFNKDEYQQVVDQLEILWRQEEKYWGLRARINWLKWGDKNTKYFHATTVQRRQRNRITMLKVNEDTWCREPNQLMLHIRKFYQTLYETVGQRNFQPVLDQCPSPVNEEMNSHLMETVQIEEVEEAVFQLGALKAPGPDGLNGQFY